MLGVKTYGPDYVAACRARVDADVAAYRAATNGKDAAFEARFFSSMVSLLDYLFVHRLRTVEGKDGNALNEVRVISNSLLQNDGRMGADPTIKLVPTKSLLKYEIGDEIRLSEADFLLLADAFFSEIEKRFT